MSGRIATASVALGFGLVLGPPAFADTATWDHGAPGGNKNKWATSAGFASRLIRPPRTNRRSQAVDQGSKTSQPITLVMIRFAARAATSAVAPTCLGETQRV